MWSTRRTLPDVTTPTDAVRLALHPGQQQVWRDASRFRVVVAGRRWGKTQLARTFLYAQALRHGAGRYWYVAPTRDDAKDIMWADLKAACDPTWITGTDAISETDLSITLRTGALVRLLSAEKGDGLRGRPLKALVLDEYADMDAALFGEILRPSLADYKAPALFIGTPKSYNHFYDLFRRGTDPAFAGQWASFQFKSLDNPFLDPAEIAEARRTTDPRTFRQEWEASFEALAGRVYYAFHRDVHVQPVALDAAAPVAIAFDFNVDPATATIGQRFGEQVRVWREVFVTHAGGEATRAAARAVRGLLDGANWRGQVCIYGDPAGKAQKTTGPADHAVLRETFPLATWRIRNAAPHVRDRIAAVNGRCESADGGRHCLIDPSCVHLIADLEQVTFDEHGAIRKDGGTLLTHISDAFGYWVEREFPSKPVITAVATGTFGGW